MGSSGAETRMRQKFVEQITGMKKDMNGEKKKLVEQQVRWAKDKSDLDKKLAKAKGQVCDKRSKCRRLLQQQLKRSKSVVKELQCQIAVKTFS